MWSLWRESVQFPVFAHVGNRSVQRDPHTLRPVSPRSPKGCSQNSRYTNVGLVEQRSFQTRRRLLSFSTHLSSRRSMLWYSGLSMVRKLVKSLSTPPQPSCRPDVMSAVLAVCLWLQHGQSGRFTVVSASEDCTWLRFGEGNPSQTPLVCSRFIESGRLMAVVICVSLWETSQCAAYVIGWRYGHFGHHYLLVESLLPAWPWTPIQVGPLWLSIVHRVIWLAVIFDEQLYSWFVFTSWPFRTVCAQAGIAESLTSSYLFRELTVVPQYNSKQHIW